MANWIPAQVLENRHWNQDLFSLKLRADIEPFTAGQFTKLGLEMDGKVIQRAYSFVNGPNSDIEIYATRVADGLLSPKLHQLKPGDQILINATASGYFTLDEVPEGEHLWLLSSGTAIGALLSVLTSPDIWQRFRKIVLVHAVRFSSDLNYQAEIKQIQKQHPDQLIVQPFVSREPAPNTLTGRIPHALDDGLLERSVGLTISQQSQFMLCGNPDMVRDTREALERKGLKKNLRREPGHITMENYW